MEVDYEGYEGYEDYRGLWGLAGMLCSTLFFKKFRVWGLECRVWALAP
jgi:hypothetical protein